MLTLEYLENCFNNAKKEGQLFVAVKVEMKGLPEHEIIVNPIENVDEKLSYYKAVYDNNLNHKYSTGVKIVGFVFANSMDEIQDDLYC